jgi:hypothetical protein
VIHYHGTPITPRAKLLELAGRFFCVRYGEHRDVDIAHEIGQGVMLDNGAYSFWRQVSRPTGPGSSRGPSRGSTTAPRGP